MTSEQRSDPAAREDIRTPCIRVCAIEPLTGLCLGCGRSLREIGAWASLSPAARDQIMATLPARLERLKLLDRDTPPD